MGDQPIFLSAFYKYRLTILNVTMLIKDYILDNIDQTLIYSYYLGILPEDIQYNIFHPNEKIRNPLRNDHNPSLSFKYYGNKLICKDFGDSRFRGDVFEIVGYVLNKNCRNSDDFVYICNDIILNCNSNFKQNIVNVNCEQELINKDALQIDIDVRNPNRMDYIYWEMYGIKKENINTKFFICDRYRLNGWQTPYRYSGSDPCYAYVVNPNRYKLYFPYRNKHNRKFITNNRSPIECLHEIRYIDYICLIKGFKDKILLDQMCREKGVNNILFLPAASETINLPQDIYDILKRYSTSGKIFTIFDTDAVGIESAKQLQSQYNTIPIYFTSNYKSKDPSDMVKDYNYNKVFTHFDNVLNQIYYGN